MKKLDMPKCNNEWLEVFSILRDSPPSQLLDYFSSYNEENLKNFP